MNPPAVSFDRNMFDTVEEVVFNALKDSHFEDFKLSPDYQQYHQFAFMLQHLQRYGLKEEADFFILRVVGRGGFGKVNACKKATTGWFAIVCYLLTICVLHS